MKKSKRKLLNYEQLRAQVFDRDNWCNEDGSVGRISSTDDEDREDEAAWRGDFDQKHPPGQAFYAGVEAMDALHFRNDPRPLCRLLRYYSDIHWTTRHFIADLLSGKLRATERLVVVRKEETQQQKRSREVRLRDWQMAHRMAELLYEKFEKLPAAKRLVSEEFLESQSVVRAAWDRFGVEAKFAIAERQQRQNENPS